MIVMTMAVTFMNSMYRSTQIHGDLTELVPLSFPRFSRFFFPLREYVAYRIFLRIDVLLVKHEVLKAVSKKMAVFIDVEPCSMLDHTLDDVSHELTANFIMAMMS
jgi:hypothetical protein